MKKKTIFFEQSVISIRTTRTTTITHNTSELQTDSPADKLKCRQIKQVQVSDACALRLKHRSTTVLSITIKKYYRMTYK